ncbi:hypothetical protein [Desulfovibrio piger]|uniref:hypothetical protein n=1 Tax=Desulfovibrio piger TaxID=901 RepID=UPI0026F13104|nr:hypothetical protein [Desulfovibrio piger]
MRKIFFLVLLVMLIASDSVARISKDQEMLINSLTDDQLYSLYISQMADAFIIQATDKMQLPYDFKAKFDRCIRWKVKKTFTPNELRDLYIQPENLDKKKARRKIESLQGKYVECVGRAMK